MRARSRPGPALARGFTLLEVLVAFLILSVGLIGLAGLQLGGVQNSRDAYYATQAVVLVQNLADSMRANLDGVDGDDYDGGTAAQTGNCLTTTGCTAAQMAGNDLFQWNQTLGAVLPGGEGIACQDSSPDDGVSAASHQCDGSGPVYAIKVWWDDDRNPATPKRRFASILQP
jgi:type IV pilus assembly protein PilV